MLVPIFRPLFAPLMRDRYLEQLWNDLQHRLATSFRSVGKVLVSAGDSNLGFLASKLLPGRGVAFSLLNPGADERLSLAVPQAALRVGSVVELQAVDTTSLDQGIVIWLAETSDFYYLDKLYVPPPAADGVMIVQSASTGYWLSLSLGRWDDLQGDISQGTGAAALTYDTWRPHAAVPPVGFPDYQQYYFRHSQNDQLSMRFQMPHKWLVGSTVYPHLHVLPAAVPAAARNIHVTGLFTWSQGGITRPDISAWTQFVVDFPVVPGDEYKPTVIPVGPIAAPPGYDESSLLLIALRRFGTDAADTYTDNKTWGTGGANLALDSLDVHIRYRPEGTLEPRPG